MGTAEPRPASRRLRLVSASGAEPPTPAHGAEPPGPLPAGDHALLLAFQRGERGIGLRLYEHLLPVVDRTLYRILGCREQDHADLVQAAFEQIVSTLSKRRFAGECSLAGWASVIACHIGLSALRARRRERRVIDRTPDPEAGPEPPARGADPEREVSAQRDLEALRRHLAAMDGDRATALLLHVMGYSIKEIADLTGVTAAAAQSRLSRGRRELQARCEPGAAARHDPAHSEELR
ncbi:RNA polymerase sigma factor [Sorangium sp. So ce315]|uniref:RNA polymerase sigma factor n=1 Tax=Sorangium sp. So ce315 TaxID=3133299 RepID=UPI003F615E0E